MLLLVSCDPPQMCKAPGTKGGRGAMCVKPGPPLEKKQNQKLSNSFSPLPPPSPLPPFSYSDCKPECWTLTQRDHTSACLTSLPTLFPRGAPSWTNHHARHFLEVEFWVLFHRAIYVNVPSPRPPPSTFSNAPIPPRGQKRLEMSASVNGRQHWPNVRREFGCFCFSWPMFTTLKEPRRALHIGKRWAPRWDGGLPSSP